MIIPNKIYDYLKWIVMILLPALETAIFGLGQLYGFDSTIICGTIAIIATFIGALIGVSTHAYNKEKAEAEVETEDFPIELEDDETEE